MNWAYYVHVSGALQQLNAATNAAIEHLNISMKLSFVQPRPELLPLIESFWVFESAIGMPAAERSLAAPNGCPKLIILYDNSLESAVNGCTCDIESGDLMHH